MGSSAIAAVILAAGHGTRMKSTKPKVLHEIGGLPSLGHTLNCTAQLSPQRRIVVVGANGERVGDAALSFAPDVTIAVQDPPQGTGDAVIKALPALDGFNGVVLVLYADTPLVKPETLHLLVEKIAQGAAVAVLGFRPEDPRAYGRLKTNKDGALEAIIEAKEASPKELEINVCNSGVMAISTDFIRRGLEKLDNKNAKQEYYLTDLVAHARSEGLPCAVLEADASEVIGIDSRVQLSEAELVFQNRRREKAMTEGVTLIDPSTVYFSHDTIIENDVVIEPNVFFGPGVKVKTDSVIKAFSHIEGATIGEKASAGPYARLRPGADLGAGSKVGNFVEIKMATLGEEAKVSHLTYIGDAVVGARANIGAGTITCNYDGFNKHVTTIGADAFIGSNSALVAPVTIGDGAYVGSGSVITKDVEKDALAVARGRQSILEGWATRFRKANNKKDK